MGVLDEKEKRKREVEDRLQTLNAKKHNLVLALKQVSFDFVPIFFLDETLGYNDLANGWFFTDIKC